MAAKKKYIIEFDAETGKFTKGLEEVKGGVDDVKKSTDKAGGGFDMLGSKADQMTGGMVSGMRNGVKGIKGMIAGMKTLKFAIAATGIGLLVVLIGSVVAAVSKLQGPMDKFKQLTAGLGAVIDVIGDSLAFIGEAIINAFTKPQDALDSITAGFKGVWDWLTQINAVIQGSILFVLLQLKKRFIETAIATKEFFGGDASGLRESLEETKLAIEAVEKAVSDAADGIKQPFLDAADAAGEYFDKLKDVAIAAANLQKAEQALEETRIVQTVAQAKRNKLIAESRLIAEDETKSFATRTAALEEALALEKQNLEEKIAVATEEARIATQRNSLSESTREDRQAEADALAKVFELEERSLKQSKRIFTELQSLQKEEAALGAAAKAKKDKEDAEQDAKDAEALVLAITRADAQYKLLQELQNTAQENEIAKLVEGYDAKFLLAQGNKELEKELTEKQLADIAAITAKYRKVETDADAATTAKKEADDVAAKSRKLAQGQEVAMASMNVLGALDAFTDKTAKKGFERSKKLNIAQTVISTLQGVVNALSASSVIPDPFGAILKGVNAASIAAVGAVQISKIKSTSFGGGGSVSAPNISSGGGGGSIPSLSSGSEGPPSVDFSFLNDGANQNSVQAYVVEQDVSSSQQANQLIEDQASL